MLELVLGRSGRGKSHYLMEQIGQDIQQGAETILYMVPDQFTLEAERQLIAHLHLHGLFAVQVLSFRRLITRLTEELGGGGYPALDEVGKAIYTSQLLYDYQQELSHYRHSGQNSTLAFSLAKIITEAKQFAVCPDHFLSSSQPKMRDIGLIYQEYQRQKENYQDQEDIISLVTSQVHRSRLLKNARVYIDSFDVFTQQAYALLEAMLPVTDHIAIALCADDGNDFLFRLPGETVEKLLRLPGEKRITRLSMNRYKRNDIGRLEENLFSAQPKVYPTTDGCLSLYEFSDIQREVEAVAVSVLENQRKGIPLRQMAVICNDLPQYGRLLTQVLNDHLIPCYLDQKYNLMTSALGQFIHNTLQCCQSFTWSHYFARLKLGLLSMDEEALERYENQITAQGIKRVFRPIEDDPELESIRQQADLTKLTKAFHQASTCQEYCAILMNYVNALALTPVSDLEEDMMDHILTILEQLSAFSGSRQMDLSLFSQLLETGMTAVEVGTLPQRMDELFIGDVSRSKLHDIQCLYVIGASDGLAPKTMRQSTLLTDDERKQLKAEGIIFGRDSRDICALERLLTYKLLSKPSSSLWISCAARSLYGETMTKSQLFAHIQQIFPSLPLLSDQQSEYRLLQSPKLAFEELIRHLHARDTAAPLWQSVYSYFLRHDPARLEKALTPKPVHLSIGEQNAAQLYGGRPLSATQLEEFFNCPFKQFIHYGLRPIPKAYYRIDQLDTGSILHDLLDRFSKTLATGQPPTIEQADVLVDQLVSEKLADYHDGLFSDNAVNRLMASRISSLTKNAVHHILHNMDQDGYRIFSSELTFGMNGVPPITLTFADGRELKLAGRIDRVDVNDQGQVRVIDYKSGKVALDYTSIYYGLKLQLLIYMEAALHHIERQKGMSPSAGGLFYLFLNESYDQFDNRKLLEQKAQEEWQKTLQVSRIDLKSLTIKEKPEPAADERMNILLDLGKRRARQAGKEIYQGNISIQPVKAGSYFACDRCRYSAICQNDGKHCQHGDTLNKQDFFTKWESEENEDGLE